MRLLERRHGRIYLSPEGKVLCESARTHFDSIDNVFNHLKHNLHEVQGHIRLGALQDSGTDFSVGHAVSLFCQKYPKVSFSIIGGTSHSLEEGLIDGKIDLSLSIVFTQKEMIRRHEVYTSWHSLYGSRKYLKNFYAIDSYEKLLELDL